MNTLEDRLRAALTAKSDGVTESMLNQPARLPDPSDTAVLLPAPPHRPHRTRWTIAAAVAVAAVLLIAFGAVALHRASTPGTVDPAQIRPRSAIPWSKVGDGWTLLQDLDNPPVNSQAALAPDQLLLIDPRGTKYRTSTLHGHIWGLMDWDHRHQRALLVEQWGNLSGPRPTEVLEVDLRTDAEQRFTAPDGSFIARYGPDGQSIVLDYGTQLAGYSLTGRPTWRLTVPVSPAAGSSFASTPDGRGMITNGPAGLNIYDAMSGQLTGSLPAPAGFGPCVAPRWQGDGKLTALCAVPPASSNRTYRPFVFSAAGSPAAGRSDPQYPAGWTTVTGFRDGTVAMAGWQLPNLTDARLARVDSTGHTTSMAIPAQFTEEWSILGSNADGFLVAHRPRLGPQLDDRLVSWNPFTGRIVDLFQMPGQAFFNAVPW